MSSYIIDLAKPEFWVTFAVAVMLLTPMACGQFRSLRFALINLGFLTVLLGWQNGAIILAGCVVAWLLTLAIRSKKLRPIFVTVALLLTIGLFLLHKIHGLADAVRLHGAAPILSVIAFSYICLRLIDMYRSLWEERLPTPSLIQLINYTLPFHMLAAGPIQSYEEFITQTDEPAKLEDRQVLRGFERLAFGVFKKFVLAFVIQKIFLTDFTAGNGYWALEAQMFFIWLYIDFSAYSDIAVGVGRIIGVHTPENFNRPYLARNITVFWERWHISLSMWIRRNLFYPTQIAALRVTDNRWPMWCASVAFAVSFLLCGLWHGIAWNFVVWGVMHASGLIFVNLYKKRLSKKLKSKGVKVYMANPYIKIVAMAITFEWVAISHLTFFFRF
jgi:D-alanyl-lipoteichoic acid acyltransferase DltB (MBOAT superfamily)